MSSQSIDSLSVLVIDTSAQMAALVSSMLRTLRIRTIQDCADAKSAIRLLNARAFDVVIIDDGLMPMGGVEFVRGLRATATCPSREAAVVMIASAPDGARIAAARDAGITEFLRKPFATEHLRTRLVSIVTNPRGFVQTRAYVGPDRRRRELGPKGEERRGAPPSGEQ
jgi:two-component system chemotaxis response regulator CheY